ncbi:MAG: lysoplasmalogenase [Acidobacteriia bacterium]|nr:lysoplasmalogenase [Terriglobia bacterium]
MLGACRKLAAIFFAGAAMAAIAGQLAGVPWLVFVFKPLATILLAGLALAAWLARRERYAFWLTVGLLFSLLGDVALLGPERYFLPGLAAFLFTHIAYLLALTRDAKFPAHVLVWLLYLAAAAALCAILWPRLAAPLHLPVALYSFFVATMAAQALGRFLLLRTPAARLAAIGAFLFLFSDALLSFDRFYAPLAFSPLFILGAYYLGQWLIVAGLTKTASVARFPGPAALA